ncbi:hypothetical protein [Burkholderia mayonis]|uniref:Uncharacterized protein n=1 Tax=Burkholderia mayonis TaxID=1385591 RepID=A0A1B4G294_9BURK|nr:hypothetical protein [Burkholderia mayonis]AOJ10036.1 hypothetical protein WS71_22580 [Burkholderia mayonis]
MDIREIQALHAQYSSQPIVIDINSHVRALPAPDRQVSARERVTVRLSSACRNVARPAAIVIGVVAAAGLTGISAAKLWHALHPPQAVAHVERSTTHTAATPPAPAATSTPPGAQRPLTGSDFAEPADRTPAATSRIDAQALRTGESGGSTATAATPAAATDLEKAAASPIRAARAASNQAAGQQQVATTQTASPPAPVAAQPTLQPAEQPKAAPHRIHRTPTRQRHEPATTEATASTPHNEPTKTEHSPKPSTPAKTGDVPLF